MSSKPQGWFVRRVRGFLEEEWDKEYLKLGIVNRWECREMVWEKAQELIGFGQMMRLIRERYDAAEQKVLESNQKSFRKAINSSRQNVDLQMTLPGMVRDEVHKNLHPIREKYVRAPGPDKDFSELIQIKDIDFDTIYEMAIVRDDSIRADQLSKEDYDFMDAVRSALRAANTQTLGQVFGLNGKDPYAKAS